MRKFLLEFRIMKEKNLAGVACNGSAILFIVSWRKEYNS